MEESSSKDFALTSLRGDGIFPELNVAQYLVVEPTKIGPRYEEYEKLYCGIFKHC